jgi:acid phosphatase type 7
MPVTTHVVAASTDAADPGDQTDANASSVSDGPATALHVVAAGDVACDGCAQGATAALIDQLVSADHLAGVLVLGDLAYPSGSATDFQTFYAPAWGRAEILRLSHPVLGNHEYASGSANGYFDYFNGAGTTSGPAGPRGEGYYSFDLGSWHLVGLNTSDQCRFVSCSETSAQHDWLVADLAAHPSLCTLAFWHHPRYQAGTSTGELDAAAALWKVLYLSGVDVVLNGHEHGYQQLSPLDDSGQLDLGGGIRTFVVGTGGGDFDTTFGGPRLSDLETSITGTHGVLELTLSPNGYQWQFVAVDGSRPSAASGSELCH